MAAVKDFVSTLRALALRFFALMKGERLKRQFLNSLRWPIYVINSVDNTNYPVEHETVLYECIEFFLSFFFSVFTGTLIIVCPIQYLS